MKNFKPRRGYVYSVLFLWLLIQLPFAFSTSNGMGIAKIDFNKHTATNNSYSSERAFKLGMLYDELHLSEKGLTAAAFEKALKGYDQLLEKGAIANDRVITIIDFTQPSYKKRMFVIDVESG